MAHRVIVRNARTETDRPALASHGFELFRHRSAVRSFADKAEVDAVYATEVADMVRRSCGADLIVPIGYIMRTANATGAGPAFPPASDVHVDMSPQTAPRMARDFYAGAGSDRPYRRFLMTSLWRSFSAPPQDWPLALCDHRSIAPEEGVLNYLIRVPARPDPLVMQQEPANLDEMRAALVFRHGPHHRWYYFPDMTSDEVILIKLHDSDRSTAWFAPHTAFHDASRPEARTRESIEFRTIAYWY